MRNSCISSLSLSKGTGDIVKGFMYILQCADGSYYTGSTKNLKNRLYQHKNGEGAKYTKTKIPVKLVYAEEFERIDEAFYREKQIQDWSRKKKEALIAGDFDKLSHLSRRKNIKESSTVTSTSLLSHRQTRLEYPGKHPKSLQERTPFA